MDTKLCYVCKQALKPTAKGIICNYCKFKKATKKISYKNPNPFQKLPDATRGSILQGLIERHKIIDICNNVKIEKCRIYYWIKKGYIVVPDSSIK